MPMPPRKNTPEHWAPDAIQPPRPVCTDSPSRRPASSTLPASRLSGCITWTLMKFFRAFQNLRLTKQHADSTTAAIDTSLDVKLLSDWSKATSPLTVTPYMPGYCPNKNGKRIIKRARRGYGQDWADHPHRFLALPGESDKNYESMQRLRPK